jgi:two-component system NtrC family sensor kinase
MLFQRPEKEHPCSAISHEAGAAMKSNQTSDATEEALRERVKELSCLYGIAQIAGNPDISLEEILQEIVNLLPPAWQYPEITSGRIVLDGRSYSTPGFSDGRHRQTADLVVGGQRRGVVEVVYSEEKPELAEGPFFREERHLIDSIARQTALIIERKQAEEERSRLQDQIRHADRLATIGLLAAGVAHELNEPVGNILGFAQLAKKCQGLPDPARRDIEKIESASLHAREVIKNLLIFARQAPVEKTHVNLNQVVEEGLYFFKARSAKAGVRLTCSLSPNLPEIRADASQLGQVFVNLVVNAIQAMPEGGDLTVQTRASGDSVFLIVKDTGAGMNDETLEKIFVPFFTTKDVGQGTGLGLAVVHGIVASHGGDIQVKSEIGRGTQFKIQLPAAETGRNVEEKG